MHLKIFRYFIDDKKSFFKYFFLSFPVGLLELSGVALTYPFINKILAENGVSRQTVLLGGLIISAFLAKNIFMILYSSLQSKFIKDCELSIDNKFINYFINGDYAAVSRIPFAKKMQVYTFLTPNLINNYLMRVLNLNVNIFVFILISSLLVVKFFTATLITLFCALILLSAQTIFFKTKTNKVSSALGKSGEEAMQAISEPLLNLKSIRVMNAGSNFFERYLQKTEALKKHAAEMLFYNTIPPFVTEPFIIILLLILLTVISVQNITNSSELVACYALVISAIFRLAPTISKIQVNLTGIQTAMPLVQELTELYEQYGINNFKQKEETVYSFNDSIELNDISFAYDNKLILNHVNLKIKKGEFIGIAGSSGVGKTTLADIIAGLLKIRTGEIYIDNKFINSTKMPALKIGYIPQEYSILAASIRENVAMNDKDIDDNKVIEALKKARLYDFIEENYNDGIYASPFVDNNGFSQGQKQRLAIARALYRDPDVIILDEATSSLDLKTEDEICNILNSLKGEKTIIAIAHRLSTIKSANRIIFMKDSTINDIGSFEKLYQTNIYFKELVQLNNPNFIH